MINIINKLLWGIATIFIVSSSLYFTFKLKFIQIRFNKMFKYLFEKNTTKGISPFKSLMLSLAGRIGVGSIAGVALAIYTGGPGSLFWLLVVSFFTTTLSFSETILGIKYREKDENGYRGGPSEYIAKGLGKKKLGNTYSLIILFSYVFGFIGIQANTITKAVTTSYNVMPYLIGAIIAIFTIIIIYGGVKSIANTTAKIVPVMALLYMLVALYITIINVNMIPSIINDILKSAFNFKSLIGGFIGTFVIGIQRGIFSNEAGLGTGAIASSVTETKSGVKVGYIQMLGIYLTSFVVCTATAMIIFTSQYKTMTFVDMNGIELTSYAFNFHLGNIGSIILLILIILFAFSTILTGYYYCESSLKSLIKKYNPLLIDLLKLSTIATILIGSVTSSSTLWKFVDILIALIAIINIYALVCLRGKVFEEVENNNMYKDKYDK